MPTSTFLTHKEDGNINCTMGSVFTRASPTPLTQLPIKMGASLPLIIDFEHDHMTSLGQQKQVGLTMPILSSVTRGFVFFFSASCSAATAREGRCLEIQ